MQCEQLMARLHVEVADLLRRLVKPKSRPGYAPRTSQVRYGLALSDTQGRVETEESSLLPHCILMQMTEATKKSRKRVRS